jgi:peptidoglycan-associated lipoprotein
MKIKKVTLWLNVFGIVCTSFFLLAGCSKKHVVPPSPSDESGVTQGAPQTGMEGTGDELSDAEAIRKQRLAALQGEVGADGVYVKKIYFDYDSSNLNAEAQEVLKEIADILRANASWSVDISGHCDERGTIEYNLALGERRARAAKDFLTDLGISEDIVSTISYGEERPVDPTSSEDAWSKNRRAEFSFIH